MNFSDDDNLSSPLGKQARCPITCSMRALKTALRMLEEVSIQQGFGV
jgi:hypothetical protein